MKYLLKKILELISSLLSQIIPKNKKLVLLGGSQRNNYNESSRYLYEYLNKNNDDGYFIWITSSKEVCKYLKEKGLPAEYYLSLKGIWYYLRSGLVICNGTVPLGLVNLVGKETIKITINHGCGPRSTIGIDPNIYISKNELAKDLNIFNFFNFTSDFTSLEIGRNEYLLPENKIINLGFPRCDHLLNKIEVDKQKALKKFLRDNYSMLNKDSKCILYAPTWRPSHHPSQKKFPLEFMDDFDYFSFNSWLLENNIYLFISGHDLSNKDYLINDLSHFIYLKKNDFFDINLVLPEFDFLLTDYSSIATDYMLMMRSVIYYMPDYNFYLNEYGLLEDIKENMPGPIVENMESLKNILLEMSESKNENQDLIYDYLGKYYDLNHTNSCLEFSKFIKKIITN